MDRAFNGDSLLDTARAAEYLNCKLAEDGDHSKPYTAENVRDAAKDGEIQYKQSNGKRYVFEVQWLHDYLAEKYSLLDTPLTSTSPTSPTSPTPSTFEDVIKRHPIFFAFGLLSSGFIAGITALIFIVPEIRSRVGPGYVKIENPITSQSIEIVTNLVLNEEPDSKFGKQLNKLAADGQGVFKGANFNNNEQLLKGLSELTSKVPEEIEPFRALVKDQVGPFVAIDRKIKLIPIDTEDPSVKENPYLAQVENSIAATCRNSFERKSAINISGSAIAPANPDTFALKTVFANIEYDHECPTGFDHPAPVWVDKNFIAPLFQDGAVSALASVAVRVELNATLQIPVNN